MRTFENYTEAVAASMLRLTDGNVHLEEVLGMVDDEINLWEEYEEHTRVDVVAKMILAAAGCEL